MKEVKVLILKTAGTNCDRETAYAFSHLGANVEILHINRLKEMPSMLLSYNILCIAGGFSYGDDISAGRVLAMELNLFFRQQVEKLVKSGGLVIGICNGFQVLVKAGLLPGLGKGYEASLIENTSGCFIDKWCDLEVPESRCIWTKALQGREISMPVAHAEGRFVASENTIEKLKNNGQIAFAYIDNPNGSFESIAGICDTTGRILGLMPHPERASFQYQLPEKANSAPDVQMPPLEIFKTGIDAAAGAVVI